MSVLVLTHVSGGRSKPVIAGCTCVHARPVAAHTVESRSWPDRNLLPADCDNSSNKHATKHYHSTKHSVVISAEPGEAWAWHALLCGAEEGATVTKYSSDIELYPAWFALLCGAEEGAATMKCSWGIEKIKKYEFMFSMCYARRSSSWNTRILCASDRISVRIHIQASHRILRLTSMHPLLL